MGGTFDNRIKFTSTGSEYAGFAWLEKYGSCGVGSSGAYYWVLKVQSPAVMLVVVPSGQGLRNVLFVAAGLVVR